MKDWDKDFERWKGEAFSDLAKTPKLDCDNLANTEVHTLTCSSHVKEYLFSIKSFLRFFSGVAVVVHDDGTLTEDDKNLILNHVGGAKIISSKHADNKMNSLLEKYPNCGQYRGLRVVARQLLDFSLLSCGEKVISLDSDTLFVDRPTELIEWICDSDEAIKCSHETKPSKRNKLEVNLGLYAYPIKAIDLQLLETTLKEIHIFDWWHTSRSPNCDIFSSFLDRHNISYGYFDKERYQNPYSFKKGADFRHYFSSDQLFGYESAFYSDTYEVLRCLEARSSSG
jgi:hypothetical protein